MYRYFEINELGCNIRCKVYYNEKCTAQKAVIFGTGFAGHKDNTAANAFADKLLSKHKNVIVVVFNWPAPGDDIKKKIALEDCSTYLRLVIEGVRKKYDLRDLYCYATSFGGYMVLKYISEQENPFLKIALRCPAINMYDLLTRTVMKQEEYERILKGKDVSVGFDRKVLVTKEFLKELKENDIRQRDYLDFADQILIIQGEEDEVVPVESSREFAENNLIDLICVPQADHRFRNPTHMSLVNKYVMEFFDL